MIVIQSDGEPMSTQQIVLLITSRKDQLEVFTGALRADADIELITIDSAEESIEAAVRLVPVLAVVDQEVDGVSGLEIVQRLLEVNAFIYTAVLTDMDEALFHERSEGLGVLADLPLLPNEKDAADLLAKLRQVAPS